MPITREEKILSGEDLTPITRKEMFLAKAAGQDINVPTPITREEMFLSKIQGGGGETVEEYDGTYDTALISFLVGSNFVFCAEEGMTWAQWVESEYNIGGYFFLDGSVYVVAWARARGRYLVPYNPEDKFTPPEGAEYLVGIHANDDTGERQSLDSVIVNRGRYTLRQVD